MQRTQRDQVNLVAEQVAEFVRQLLDLPAQLPPRSECVEDVDVAVRPGRPASLGAENLQLCDPVPVADLGQALFADLSPRYLHDPRLTRSTSPARRRVEGQPVPDPVRQG